MVGGGQTWRYQLGQSTWLLPEGVGRVRVRRPCHPSVFRPHRADSTGGGQLMPALESQLFKSQNELKPVVKHGHYLN